MMRFGRFIISLLLISKICGVAIAQNSLNVRMLGEVHHFVEQSYDESERGRFYFL